VSCWHGVRASRHGLLPDDGARVPNERFHILHLGLGADYHRPPPGGRRTILSAVVRAASARWRPIRARMRGPAQTSMQGSASGVRAKRSEPRSWGAEAELIEVIPGPGGVRKRSKRFCSGRGIEPFAYVLSAW
jgi:hypothetical protein